MSMFSPPRMAATLSPKSMASSDNSHTSESAVSQPGSKYSSNTSSGTHFPSISPIPRGAEPPQVNLLITEYNVGFNPNVKRKGRVLRKPHPPPSISNSSIRNGGLFYMADRGPPSRSSRVPVNLNDTASFPGTSYRRSLLDDSVLPPTPSYEGFRYSHSLGNSYESQAIDRPIPPADPAPHTFGTLTRPTDAHGRPHMKAADTEENEGSHAIAQSDSHSRTSFMKNTPLVHRDKPLPSLPGLSPSLNGLASSKPVDPLPSHRLLPYTCPSYPSPSKDEQAVPPFDHFAARRNVNNLPDYELKRYAHTDVGHTETWFESGHSASVTRYVCSDTRDHVSGPHFPHNPNLRPCSHPLAFSSTSRLASCSPEFSTPSVPPPRPTHSPALYAFKPPVHHTQDTHGLTRGLSWGKCFMRTLSITLFRRNTVADNPTKDLPYLSSDPGRGSTFYQPASVAHPLVPLTRHKPRDTHPHYSSRKLRKRAPSISHSRSSTSPPILTSRSSPAPYPRICRSRESMFELCDAPSQNTHSKFDTSPKPGPNKKRSMSNPILYTTVGSSMMRHSGLDTSTPTLPAQWFQSQPTTPTSSRVRKLVKRHAKRKIAEGLVEERSSLTLPPLRAQSPINLDFNPPGLSDMSRYRSAPNIGPTDFASGHYLSSHYATFPTDSPSESPHASESPVGERSSSEHHHSLSRLQDLPFLLHSRSSRRWTLAVFDAPEEQMVEELDRLRNVGWGPGFQGELVRVKSRPINNTDSNDKKQGPGANLEKEELEEWLFARKALMVCREIMHTEKSYREGLIKLQRGETLRPPPPLLLQYLPALISASLAFSARLDDDPSTYGISVAFLAAEDALEVALVAWSGIVGEFFGAATGKQRRTLEKEKKGTDKNKKDKNKAIGAPVLPVAIHSDLGHDSTHSKTKNVPGNRRTSMPSLSQLLTSPSETSPVQQKSRCFSPSTMPTAAKLPTVQDLAIQPTQRVMRYVLLYKDLLNSTPTISPARGLVERALEGANRIAQRCNRAQDNAAFLT